MSRHRDGLIALLFIAREPASIAMVVQKGMLLSMVRTVFIFA